MIPEDSMIDKIARREGEKMKSLLQSVTILIYLLKTY